MSEIIIVSDAPELRAVEEQHVTPLHQSVPKNRTWLQQSLNWPQFVESEDGTRKNVQGSMMLHQRGHAKVFLIFEQGEVTGVISLNQTEPPNKAAHIGYWLDEEHQGKGILSQALQAMIHHYTQHQKIRYFVIKCRVDNVESNQVALRNGFRLEGCMQQVEFPSDDYHDMDLYARIIDGSPEQTGDRGARDTLFVADHFWLVQMGRIAIKGFNLGLIGYLNMMLDQHFTQNTGIAFNQGVIIKLEQSAT